MLRLGIVGLPNVGKSTLFNALTSAGVLAANYPFATKDPNIGRVNVPDDRLDELARIVQPQRTVPAAVEFVDIAGLVEGASQGRRTRQPVPRQHPRDRRHRARRALLRRRRRPARDGLRRPRARPRGDRVRARARRSRHRREATRSREALGEDGRQGSARRAAGDREGVRVSQGGTRPVGGEAESRGARAPQAALAAHLEADPLRRRTSPTPSCPARKARTSRRCAPRSRRAASRRRSSPSPRRSRASSPSCRRRTARISSRRSASSRRDSIDSFAPASTCSDCRPTSPPASRKCARGRSIAATPRRRRPA